MNKYLLWGIVLAYWIWPIDLIPGSPIDDIIIVAMAWYRDEISSYIQDKKGKIQ